MAMSGFDLNLNQFDRINRNLQDFSTNTKPAEVVTPEVANKVSSTASQTQDNKEQIGTTLKISDNGIAAIRAAKNQEETAPNSFSTINFSTKPENEASQIDDNASDNNASDNKAANKVAENQGNSVLNQYRFFVPTTQYSGDEGVVRRIFG